MLGRTQDQRQEIFATVSYGDIGKFRVTFMADYEWVKYDSVPPQYLGHGGRPARSTPTPRRTARTTTGQATNKDNNWLVGVGLDWQATERLLVKGSASTSGRTARPT